jgi:hypothetical protein
MHPLMASAPYTSTWPIAVRKADVAFGAISHFVYDFTKAANHLIENNKNMQCRII